MIPKAAALGIHPNSLYRRCKIDNKVSFGDYLATKKANGNRLLKMKQFEIAMTGDKTMLVWLGKQRLDQAEKVNNDHTTKGDKLPAPPPPIVFYKPGEDDSSEK